MWANRVVIVIVAALAVACERQQGTPAASRPAHAIPPEAATSPAPVAAAESPPPGALRAYVWDCDGQKLQARNLWREHAVAVDLHDGTHKLLSTPSASGARYADGSVALFTKGGSATLTISGRPARQCNEIRSESLLADARIRGVLYIGRGNEPGWSLEVGPGSALVWAMGYGQERHEYAGAQATGDTATGRIYTATDSAGGIKAVIRRVACRDDMSGAAFDHLVAVSIGSREYRGCGTLVQP